MKKRHMRLISVCFLFIAITLLFSGQESRADSGFEGGDGTPGNPYLIRTPEQLDAIRNNLSAHYKLVDDIDMSEFGNWEPIGGFKGTLDGNGYSILNLKSHHNVVAKRTGLFGILEGTVKNLQLINVDVYGHDSVGGIAGEIRYGGIIQNSFVTGIVKAQRDFVAGIVALDMYGGGKIENTYAAAEVISEINSFNKGGIDSFFYGSVINSYYDQELSGPLESGKGIPKSTAEMKQQSTYQCWDFTNRWAIDPDINDGYPYLNLRNITELAPPYSVSVPAQAQKGGTTIDFQWTTRSYCGEADGETYEVQFYDGENWHDIEKDALTISYNADNSVKTGSYTLPSVNTKEAKFRVRAVIDSYTSPYTESEAFTILSTPPTLTLDGSMTYKLEKGNAYVEPGATATDAVGNNLSDIVINGTVDTNTVGAYILTYSVEDSAGNHTELTRTVEVAPHKAAIVGGYETVRVANADTNALLTLYQKQADGSIVKIREEATAQSEFSFVDIPAGKDYYVTQTVNDIESFPSDFVEVLAKVPPSAPPSVTTPPPLKGGKHTVSWGAVTDWGSGMANSREYHILLYIDEQLKSVVETGQSDNPSTSMEIEIPTDVSTNNAEIWVRGSTHHGESTDAKSGNFIIDNKAPALNVSPNGGNYAKNHLTTVTATDSHSGIANIEYVWTNSSSFPATDTFASVNSGETLAAPTSSGDHYLHVRATDKVGNVQTFTSDVFQIDTTDPTITITPSTSDPTNQDVTLTVTGSDAHSGVRRIRIVDGTWVDGDSLTHTVTKNGTYSFEVEDHAGNTHTASIDITNIDKTAPTVNVSPNGGNYAKNHSTKVTATDSHSGIDNIEYVWTTSSTFPNTGFVNINSGDTIDAPTSSGDHYLHVRATDKVGNVQTFTSQVFQIDTTDPTLTITPSTSKPTNQDITLTVTGSDAHSGVRRIRIAEGTWVDGDSLTHTVTENGTYSFDVEDHVGNTHTASIEIKNIDKVPPVITIDPYPMEPTNQDITVTATTDKGTLNQSSYTFTSNGSFEFIATDEAGNETKKTVTITNIDKIAPTVIFDPDGNSGKRASRATTEVTVDDDHSGVDANSLRYMWTNDIAQPADDDTRWRKFTNGEELTLSGKNGDWYLHIVALDKAGNDVYKISGAFSLFYNPPAPPPSDKRTAKIVTGQDEQYSVEIDIIRKIQNGKLIDEVALTDDTVAEVIDNASDSDNRTVRIIVDDLPDAPADEVTIHIASPALHALSQADITVSLETTGGVIITLPQQTIEQLGVAGDDLYFRIIPIRDAEERQIVTERVLSADELLEYAQGQPVRIVGQPMMIETNYSQQKTIVQFPLADITLPFDPNERETFLTQLAVYIEHSDGENVVKQGKIIYDDNGKPTSIEIDIDKFSTFTMVTTAEEITPQIERLYGDNRYETSLALSKHISDHSLDTVILASGRDFPDALAGGTLVKALNSTVLLIDPKAKTIDQKLVSAIKRVLKQNGRIVLLGGEVALPQTVETQLSQALKGAYTIERIYGKNRIETAIAIANEVNKQPEHVFIVSGKDFADALSIVPYANKNSIPIMLNQSSNGLDDALKSYLQEKKVKRVTLIGGTVALPETVAQQLKQLGIQVERISGKIRFLTSYEVVKKFYPNTKNIAIANGFDFPDALSASRIVYDMDMPVVLSYPNKLIPEIEQYIKGLDLENIILVGGESALSDDTLNFLRGKKLTLTDIQASWAKKEIEMLVERGILSGYNDSTFKPTKSITRGEFASVLVKLLDLQPDPEAAEQFTDVHEWAKGYVGALVNAGITTGKTETTFGTDDKLSRADMAVFFIRAMGLEDEAKSRAYNLKFKDAKGIPAYAAPHIALATDIGFIKGNNDGTYRPKEASQRQAVARLAYEFYEKHL